MFDININQIAMYIWELVLIHVFNMYILLTVDIFTITYNVLLTDNYNHVFGTVYIILFNS